MSEDLQHACEEHEDIFLREGLSALAEVSLEVGQSLLHLDVPLLECVDAALLLLQDITPTILHNVGVWVSSNLAQQLYLFSKDKLSLFIIESHFLDALDHSLLVCHLVYDTIASANHLPHLETLV